VSLPKAVEELTDRVGGQEAARLLREIAGTLDGLPPPPEPEIIIACLHCGCRSFDSNLMPITHLNAIVGYVSRGVHCARCGKPLDLRPS